MITALSLNPSIDRTLIVDDFCVGGLNRVKGQKDVAAGKGVNVALAAVVLGQDAECIGFMYREGGSAFEKRLHENGVGSDFVWCEGAVRVNVKVFDEKRGEITELNQSGAPVNDELLQKMNGRKTSYCIAGDQR
jgi:1-phosphofructokinase